MIGNVVQSGSWIYIYDENNKRIGGAIPAGKKPGDGLKGYTSNTVNVQSGSWIYTYDEKGKRKGSAIPAGK